MTFLNQRQHIDKEYNWKFKLFPLIKDDRVNFLAFNKFYVNQNSSRNRHLSLYGTETMDSSVFMTYKWIVNIKSDIPVKINCGIIDKLNFKNRATLNDNGYFCIKSDYCSDKPFFYKCFECFTFLKIVSLEFYFHQLLGRLEITFNGNTVILNVNNYYILQNTVPFIEFPEVADCIINVCSTYKYT